jgi:hypothetical protein
MQWCDCRPMSGGRVENDAIPTAAVVPAVSDSAPNALKATTHQHKLQAYINFPGSGLLGRCSRLILPDMESYRSLLA